MTTETCKHCGQHPYEYVDVCRGAAKPEVVCCEKAQLETGLQKCRARFPNLAAFPAEPALLLEAREAK